MQSRFFSVSPIQFVHDNCTLLSEIRFDFMNTTAFFGKVPKSPGFGLCYSSIFSGFQAFRLSGFQVFRLSGFQAFRLSDFQTFRLSGIGSFFKVCNVRHTFFARSRGLRKGIYITRLGKSTHHSLLQNSQIQAFSYHYSEMQNIS